MLDPGIISFKLISQLAKFKHQQTLSLDGQWVYTEAINFNTSFNFSWLTEICWSEDQLKERRAVMDIRKTERYAGYADAFWKGLPKCTVELCRDKVSRRAVIHFGVDNEVPSCLCVVQFLIRNDTLDVIASFRSWEIGTFAQYDLCILEVFALEAKRHFSVAQLGTLFINAGSTHITLPA